MQIVQLDWSSVIRNRDVARLEIEDGSVLLVTHNQIDGNFLDIQTDGVSSGFGASLRMWSGFCLTESERREKTEGYRH